MSANCYAYSNTETQKNQVFFEKNFNFNIKFIFLGLRVLILSNLTIKNWESERLTGVFHIYIGKYNSERCEKRVTFFKYLSDAGVGVLLPLILITCGAYFTIYLGGFYLLHPCKTWRLMFSREGGGKVSPLRALSVSLAGTLGVGNIVGVAVAIIMGGAGALFWMWISAFLSMILKYAEIVLAMRYRSQRDGEIIGGPMYYMKNGIGGKTGKMFASVFAMLGLLSSLTVGNVVQMNAAADAAYSTFHFARPVFGIVVAGICAVVIFGGFRGISRVTSVAIPVMSGLYLVLSARAVILDAARIPQVMNEIIRSAFSVSAASGGIIGFLLSGALRHGVAKGSFTHEAGCGTAPMAHVNSDTKIPAKQGLLGIFEVFFDTIVMCTLTGFVILLANDGEFITDNGMLLVIYSFSKYYGKKAAYLISFSILLFAFATIICWAYYGKTCLTYFTRSRKAETVYLVAYCSLAAAGAVMSQGLVWEFSDISVAVMTVLNLAAVLWLRREVRMETECAGLCRPSLRCSVPLTDKREKPVGHVQKTP